MNKVNVPQLRFSGFDGEWESKTLYDISRDISYGMNAAAKIFDGTHKYIRITDIDSDSRKFSPNPLTSPEGEIDERFKLKINDIVFTRTGASVGKSYLYDEADGDLYYAGFLIKVNIIKANSYFIFCQTLKNSYDKWVQVNSMRSGQPGLNAEEYKSLKLSLPNLPEQQKIASFLSAVDEKIQQLSRKKRLLEQYKKGVMQQLFSGKLRFKDENGKDYPDWEEKKLGECYEIKAGGDIDSKNSSKIKTEKFKYPIYANSEKSKGLYGYSDIFKIDYDCITVSGRGSLGIANARFEKFYPIVRLLILKPKKNIDVLFSEYALNLIEIYSESTGVPQLTAPQYSSYLISFPCLEEQQKIANFLSNIDIKIENTNQEINKMQNFKKGLLQQMFV